jgi:hypothetical protein
MENRGAAARKNAVECEQTLKLPEELYYLFSSSNNKPV